MDPVDKPPLGLPGNRGNRGGNGTSTVPQPEGPFLPQGGARQKEYDPDVFDAGDFWKVGYNFRAAGIKGPEGKGDVPHPTQARIDTFERAEATLAVEFEVARQQAVEAQKKLEAFLQSDEASEDSAIRDKLMAEMEKAFAEKEKTLKLMREQVA